ncbi:hypothetical protein DIPPA_07228 [Diplonema papillatum]|nr:hypothetical protein DIPPA_07228 [Diplonema papillatum]
MTEPTYQKVPEPQFDEVQKPVAFEYASVDKQAETATAVPLEATVVTRDTTGHFLPACIGTYCCGVFGVLGTLMCCPSNHGKGGAATGCAVFFFKLMVVSVVALVVVNHQHGPSSFEASGVDGPTCERSGGKWVHNDERTYFHFSSREGNALSDGHHGEHRGGGRHHRGAWGGHRGEEGEHREHHERHSRRHLPGGVRRHMNFSDPEVIAYVNQKLTSYVLTHPEDLAVVEMLGLPVESRRAFMKSQGRSFRRHVREIVDFAAFRQQRHAEQGTAVPANETGGMHHRTHFSDPEVITYINQKLTSYVSTHPEDLAVVEMLGLPVESRRAFMKSQGRSFRRHIREIVDIDGFQKIKRQAEQGTAVPANETGGMRPRTHFSDPEVVAYVNQKLTSYVSTHPEDLAVVEMLRLPVESRRAFMKSRGRSFRRHVHKIVDFAAFRQQRHAEQGTAVPAIEPHMFTDENMPRPDDDMHCRCPAYYITVFHESGNVYCRRSVAYWWGSLISTTLLMTSFLLLRAYYLKRATSPVTVTVQPAYAAEGIVVQA